MKTYKNKVLDQAWEEHCRLHSQRPLFPDVQFFVDFLGKSYAGEIAGRKFPASTLKAFKVRISKQSSLAGGLKYGDVALVKQFIRGLNRLHPSTPKYDRTWNPAIVLRFIVARGKNEELSLVQLRAKTVALLRFACICRSHDLTVIYRPSIVWEANRVRFRLRGPKEARGKFTNLISVVKLETDAEDEKLICPFRAWRCYWERTKEYRKNWLQENSPAGCGIFVSKNMRVKSTLRGEPLERWASSEEKDYASLGSQSLAKIMKGVMKQAGVDTSVFKAHSARSAMASLMLDIGGADVESLLKRARWKSQATFVKWYRRAIEKDQEGDGRFTQVLSVALQPNTHSVTEA